MSTTNEMRREDYISLIYRILRGSNEPVERPLPDPWNTAINHAFEADGDPYTWKELCLRSLNGQAESIIEEVFVLLNPEDDKPGEVKPGEAAKRGPTRQEKKAADEWLNFVGKCLAMGETGDADLLAQMYKDRIAYDATEKQWYFFNDNHWEKENKRTQVARLVAFPVAAQYHDLAAEIRRKAGDDADSEGKSPEAGATGRAKSLRNRNRINNVLDLASKHPDLRLDGDEWDTDPMLLACANGVINLKTGEHRPGRADDYIRTASPVAWAGLDAPAPRWEQFISEIFGGNQELGRFVQRFLGYGITAKITEHKMGILWGTKGSNGKGALFRALGEVLGDYISAVGEEVLLSGKKNPNAASPHVYSLRFLRIAYVSESDDGDKLEAGKVKNLTGGDELVARLLHSNPIRFKPKHLLLLMTNHKPHISADDHAMWRRVMLIPFTQIFKEFPTGPNEQLIDTDLDEKLRAEAPGILAWLVRGCLAWQQEGLNPPAEVKNAVAAYRAEEDDMARFIEDCCITGPGYEIEAQALYNSYKTWAADSGLKPINMNRFGEKIRNRMEYKRRSDGGYYIGLTLLSISVQPQTNQNQAQARQIRLT